MYGDSKIILLNSLLCPISIATPVPNDSPYKIMFFDFTPLSFNHVTAFFASLYKLASVGFPGFPLNPLQEIIKIFNSNLFNSFNL